MPQKISGLFILLAAFVCFSRADENDYFTPAERNAIEKLRPLINTDLFTNEFQRTDDFLFRWLVARDMDVKAAADMLLEALKWRRYNRIDPIKNETVLVLDPVPYLLEGYDKTGHPLLMFSPSHVDHRKLIIQGQREKVVRYWFQILEKCTHAIFHSPKHADGRNVTKGTVILDLHGYNLKQHFCTECISVYKEWFVGLEKYYPEGIEHFVIINMPKTAKQLIEIIRPLLSKSADRALRMFEPNKREWSAFLLKIIAPDQLPFRFGGTKPNPY